MEFKTLVTEEELNSIQCYDGYCIIFKHNTTCPISKATRSSFEKEAGLLPEGTPIYFLDLLSYRDISNALADKFEVKHQSPQLLLIKNGKCVLFQSHYDISAGDAAEAIKDNQDAE